jgi:hypothetical protein
MNTRMRILVAGIALGPAVLDGQFNVKFGGRDLQIHSFASQSFLYSNNNNYLTTDTSRGSFAFTDAGANISTQLSDKFRVGAQMYMRNIGTLGEWHPVLDWAVADYNFMDWFGVRGGKVKTILGLYNDTQDMEFVHTWAVLPQSLYTLDLRSSTIAHVGGDIYGEIHLKKNLGSVSCTAYAGRSPDDKHGGFRDVALQQGRRLETFSGWVAGGDLRWDVCVLFAAVGLFTSGRQL